MLTSERVLCCSLADFRVTTICLPTLLTSCVRDNGSMMMAPPGERTQASRKRAREREGVRGGQTEATGTCWRRGKGDNTRAHKTKRLAHKLFLLVGIPSVTIPYGTGRLGTARPTPS